MEQFLQAIYHLGEPPVITPVLFRFQSTIDHGFPNDRAVLWKLGDELSLRLSSGGSHNSECDLVACLCPEPVGSRCSFGINVGTA
jgi:hypothetical protein